MRVMLEPVAEKLGQATYGLGRLRPQQLSLQHRQAAERPPTQPARPTHRSPDPRVRPLRSGQRQPGWPGWQLGPLRSELRRRGHRRRAQDCFGYSAIAAVTRQLSLTQLTPAEPQRGHCCCTPCRHRRLTLPTREPLSESPARHPAGPSRRTQPPNLLDSSCLPTTQRFISTIEILVYRIWLCNRKGGRVGGEG